MSSKKRTKSSKKPTKKDKHALSPIEKELLAYCEKRQPVLLHGNDDYDREKLVKRIHLLNGGEERSWEYQGDGDLHNEIKKIWVAVTETSSWDDGKRERVNKLLSDCDDTIRTYRSFNDTFEIYRSGNRGDFLSGQEVFKGLTSFRHKSSVPDGEVLIWYLYERNPSWTDDTELLQYKGTLFLDHLGCQEEDKEWYGKIGKRIESHKRSVHKPQRGWLVFYAEDRSSFPTYFTNQVEPVSLDRKDYEGKHLEGKAVAEEAIKITCNHDRCLLEYNKDSAKLLPIRRKLLKYLWENKDSLVTREEIFEHLWRKGANVYDQQITDHIKEIINAFAEIDIGYTRKEIKEHIITTVKGYRKTGKEGGYIFHSKLVSLHWV
jgi:hypothetical protein